MDPRERKWIDYGLEAIFGPWKAPTLKEETEERAKRLESPFGRLPATEKGWGEENDDPEYEERLEEEARRQEQERRKP